MKDERFPLGVPVNRPKPAAHKPEREEVKRGVFSVGGKLQTELPILGPRHAPIPVPETTEGDDLDVILFKDLP